MAIANLMHKQEAIETVSSMALKLSKSGFLRLVVGLSGGADSSLALLLCVKARELNPNIFVQAVHCIHGLDADDPIWLKHCTLLCQKLTVPLVTPKLNIIYGNGRSPEEISRSQRYAALLNHLHGGALVLGHQADDQIENFFLALKRGAGPQGLSGMRYLIEDERGTIIRPLLQLHKQQIEQILKFYDLDYVYDISNSYLKFERNFIRLKVLPLLKERFAGLDAAILRSQRLVGYEHDLAMRYCKDYLAKAYTGEYLDLSVLDLTDKPLIMGILRLFLLNYQNLPAEYVLLEQVYKLCCGSADQQGVIKLGDLSIRRYLERLYVVEDLACPQKGRYRLRLSEQLQLGDYVYELVATKQGFALIEDGVVLDFTRCGSLILKPLQRTHSRSLKKLLGEFKVPYWQRGCQCIVYSQQKPIALGDLCLLKDCDLGNYVLRISAQKKSQSL